MLGAGVHSKPGHSFIGVSRECVRYLKAAAVCTRHLSHNRSDSSTIWIICKNPFKDLSCSVLICVSQKHWLCSSQSLMHISERLYCIGSISESVWPHDCNINPPLSLLSKLLSSLTSTSMRCIHLQTANKNGKHVQILQSVTEFNFMSTFIYCSFTVVWDFSGQLPAVHRVGCVSLNHCNTEVSSAETTLMTLRQSRETGQIDQTAFFLPLMLIGCSAAGQWGRKDVTTKKSHQHEAVFYSVHP